MTNETQQAKSSNLRRLWRVIMWRVLPAVLLLAIVWSSVRVIGAFWSQYSDYSTITARQDAYAQTATAIAPDDNADADARQSIQLIDYQFATNTPMPTQTPDVTSTPIPPTANVPATPVALPTFYLPRDRAVERAAGTAVPTRVPTIPRDYELVNIVLLGGDDDLTSDNSVRTDTMIIVSINTDTQTVSMMSLPRDIFVYVPTAPYMVRLNTVYGIGENLNYNAGVGGFGLLRETIFYNFGIQTHYYAKVNFTDFKQIIDTLGGIDIAVSCPYQDYALVDTQVPEEAYFANETDEADQLWTLPIGYYNWSGAEALWYARTRRLTTDFDRGPRQQQLLRGILRAGLNNGQLAQVPALWDEMTQVVETDLTLDVVLGLLPIALNLDPATIQTFSMTRTYHTTPWQPTEGVYQGQAVQVINYDPMNQLFSNFYQPPTQNRLTLDGPTIAVYNGTTNSNWDIVASERLRELGLNAYAAGLADQQDYTTSTVIDYVADNKGSPIPTVIDTLNIAPQNITVEPSTTRTVDYQVIVGEDYNSCPDNVLTIQADE